MSSLKPREKGLTEWLRAARAVRHSCQNPTAFDELIAHQEARLKAIQNSLITYRVATLGDADGILTILAEVAPEIPVSLATADEQRLITTVTGECINTEKSRVAVDAGGAIVGVVLARRLPHKGTGLFLEYIGVSKSSRNRRIFIALMDRLKSKDVPLNATVLSGNQSNMLDRLLKIGFTKVQTDDSETKLRWEPARLAKS